MYELNARNAMFSYGRIYYYSVRYALDEDDACVRECERE